MNFRFSLESHQSNSTNSKVSRTELFKIQFSIKVITLLKKYFIGLLTGINMRTIQVISFKIHCEFIIYNFFFQKYEIRQKLNTNLKKKLYLFFLVGYFLLLCFASVNMTFVLTPLPPLNLTFVTDGASFTFLIPFEQKEQDSHMKKFN